MMATNFRALKDVSRSSVGRGILFLVCLTVDVLAQSPTPTATSSRTPVFQCTAIPCVGGTLECPSGPGTCTGGCGTICIAKPTLTPTPSLSPSPQCTPALCDQGSHLACPPELKLCQGGCGVVCVKDIPATPTLLPLPVVTPVAQCTAISCASGRLVCVEANGCLGGCGTICVPDLVVAPTIDNVVANVTAIPIPIPEGSACDGSSIATLISQLDQLSRKLKNIKLSQELTSLKETEDEQRIKPRIKQLLRQLDLKSIRFESTTNDRMIEGLKLEFLQSADLNLILLKKALLRSKSLISSRSLLDYARTMMTISKAASKASEDFASQKNCL